MIDLASIIIAITSLVIIWVIVSIPVWMSAKIFLSRRASFGCAMLVTAVGPIVYAVVLIVSTTIISLAVGSRLSLITSIGVFLAFLAWIYVFKRGFETGWIRATAIAIIAILVFVMIGVTIGSFIHHIVPNVPPVVISQPFQSV
ncbi:MAG TPA: hypothetical protein VEH06_00090 [Candidatus Bathyarchaeia archaeon]|nr:hypothetical protein [Candidatus Bathyarchaeia archaeon]